MVQKIYVAGPLFNGHERWYLEQITAALESAGFETFLPHRDAGILGDLNDLAERQRIFRMDLSELDRCDLIVALLTGADHDSGTCGELGYMYAHKKPCYGISDDVRRVNNLIWGLCAEGANLTRSIEELLNLLAKKHPQS